MTDILKIIPLPVPRPDFPEVVPVPSVEVLPLPDVSVFEIPWPELPTLPFTKDFHLNSGLIALGFGIFVLAEVFGYYIGNKIGVLWKKNKSI